jgi:DNA polymerase-4
VAEQLRRSELVGRTVTVKIKFGDFTTITRSHTLPVGVDTAIAIATVSGALIEGVDPAPGVRLLGVSMSGLHPRDAPGEGPSEQMSFDLGAAGAPPDPTQDPHVGDEALRLQSSWHAVTTAVDAIRSRYGRSSVGSAAMVGNDGLHVPTRREAPWGPSAAGDGNKANRDDQQEGDDGGEGSGA